MNYIDFIRCIPKTIFFNFIYFSPRVALRLPVLISHNVVLLCMRGSVNLSDIRFGCIRIGFGDVGIVDNKYQRSIWELKGDIHFKGKAFLGAGSKISVQENGLLEIGNNLCLSANSSIVSKYKISLGDGVLISWGVQIMDCDFHKIKSYHTNEVINPDKEIKIGNKVWICNNVSISKGVEINDANIIAANSKITKSFSKKNCIFTSHQGANKILKECVYWEN